MNDSEKDEKRKYPRISKKVAVYAKKLAYPISATMDVKGTGKDISIGGVSFVSTTPFDPGTVVNLKIEIAGWSDAKRPYSMMRDVSSETPLSVIGEVVWSRRASAEGEFEIGVSFNNIYEDDYRALVRYMKPFTEKEE
jgi:hypothetical protein